MKHLIAKLLAEETKFNVEEIETFIEIPPRDEMGDFAFPCFILAKNLKKSPAIISKDLSKKLNHKLPKEIQKVNYNGAYVNFFISKNVLAKNVLAKVIEKDFGENNFGKGEKIVIDMSSPNIAKPFGIGHLRSTIIGNSIGKICEANGFEVVRINYLGDWGTQFGKIIFGYNKWGDEKKLEKNPIAHLYELYVKSGKKEFEEASRIEFKKLENGDTDNMKLWEKFKKLSLDEFNKIYDLLNVKFDVISGESYYNDKMDEIIDELEKNKLIKKDNGALIVDLQKDGLGIVLIQKKDGTSLYTTRELAAAIERKRKYKFYKMIYDVGQEQELHFKQVFKILEKMGNKWAKDCIHVAHGLYLDKDRKKFATRKGKTVFMKDILDMVIEKSKKNLLEREKLPKKELEYRAKKIALAAILYGDLKNSKEKNIVFNVDKFLKFEGDTGPYLLYSYARANSIIKKVKSNIPIVISDLKEQEIKLLKKINEFNDIIEKSYNSLSPNIVANYSFELSQIFNEFYHTCPVLGDKKEGFRLKVVEAFKITLKKSLGLLGIDTVEEM